MASAQKVQGPPPIQTAKVKVLAIEEATHDGSDSSVEQRMLDRIKKCLARAQHPNTPEAEAQAAWRMASRLMGEHNITQADLLSQTTSRNDHAALGGHSTVAIVRTTGDTGRVINQTWVNDVGNAMEIFFDCICYSTACHNSVEWTFCGIPANTVAAALAFETAHNLTLEWSRSKTGRGVKYSYCLGIGTGLKIIAHEEKKAEKERAQAEEKRTKDPERRRREEERKREQDRRKTDVSKSAVTAPNDRHSSPCRPNLIRTSSCQQYDIDNATIEQEIVEENSETKNNKFIYEDTAVFQKDGAKPSIIKRESCDDDSSAVLHNGEYARKDDVDDVDDNEPEPETEVTFKEEDEKPIDLDGDFEEQLHEIVAIQHSKKPDPVISHVTEEGLSFNTWSSSQALVQFRLSAIKVAEEYLKSTGTKLHSGPSPQRNIRDWEAYHGGVKDSRKIDVKRRRIESA